MSLDMQTHKETVAWIEQLEATGAFKVLRRLDTCSKYNHCEDDHNCKAGAAIDVETTGLNHESDAIIQLSLVSFTYDKVSGAIYNVDEPLTFFEDPGRPIPAEITELTGISDEDVAGKRIDDRTVLSILTSVSLIVAHNASFDRPFAERRIPSLAEKYWACSMKDVPWKRAGITSSKLEYLLIKHCNRFYGAHRADNDCLALIHLLATPFADGALPMRLLLDCARCRTTRIWAAGAPFEMKGALKARGYQWSASTNGTQKCWYRDVREAEAAAEQEWLSATIYSGRRPQLPTSSFNALQRYSNRI